MEEQELPNLIKAIKQSSSKSKLFRNLKILRRIVNDKSQFTKVRELGGLRLILTFLPNKTPEIVDIILSIIGNCCTQKECAKEVCIMYQIIYLLHLYGLNLYSFCHRL